MFEPFNKETASTIDRVAWILCQIYDDDAPLRWTSHRWPARCMASSKEFMYELAKMTTPTKHDREALVKQVYEEIGRYGVRCSETKELAPSRSLLDAIAALTAQGGEQTADSVSVPRAMLELWLTLDDIRSIKQDICANVLAAKEGK